ncbi:50S ribosomal protein L28 [Candidatus Hodgkinia cicadicola]|nr:50S ribosomal protein L28 [Candidatus Hodgkinia cicadicola]
MFGKRASFSNKKTKRKLGINYKRVKLWSFALKQLVKLKTSVKLLKTIKRYGGIDF